MGFVNHFYGVIHVPEIRAEPKRPFQNLLFYIGRNPLIVDLHHPCLFRRHKRLPIE